MANFNIDYLVIAGGGAGGGYYRGGGGGAGELKESASSIALSAGSPYGVAVGAGGAGVIVSSDNGSNGNNGDNSTFHNITSLGGGGGSPGDSSSGNTGSDGGSGGGAGGNWGGAAANGGSATGTGLGNNGGAGAVVQCGGGGGGATQSGFTAGTSGTAGDGGAGKTYTAATSITGQAFSIAGGGGGANYGSGNITVGGIGGGAAGASGTSPYASGPSAANNTGGGGGGGNGVSPQGAGGGGGSGIVILRYATADVSSYATTGITPTEDTTTIPGQTILSFTAVGTGTITFTALTPPTPPLTRVTNPVTGFNSATEEGLKLPSGDNSNQPAGAAAEQGMIRNDTEETVDSSASAIAHYNGTNWQYFAATESPDNPLPAGAQIVYSANDTASYPGTGTTWFDISGNSNDATLTNTTYSNGYLSFNGSSSKVTTSYSTNTSNASFAAWVNCNNVSTYNNFINKGYYSSGSNTNYLHLVNYANASPVFTIRLNGSSVSAQSSVAMTNNTWHHVVGTVSSTGDMKIYLDGTQTGSQTGAPARNMTQSVLSGVYLDGNQQFFSGEISKIQVYDTVLTATDVTDLYNAGSGTT